MKTDDTGVLLQFNSYNIFMMNKQSENIAILGNRIGFIVAIKRILIKAT
jgi:hypothetical protein